MGFSFKTFTAETLTSSDLNAQLTKIENKLGAIRNSDIAADAGITSAKLRDRYGIAYQTIVLRGIDVADTTDTWADADAVIIAEDVQDSTGTGLRVDCAFPGKQAFLCSVIVRVDGYARGSGDSDDMSIHILKNGSLIDSIDVTASGSYFLRAGAGASAFSTPFASLQDGDYFEIKIGNQTSTDVPECTMITVTFAYKVELSA